MKISKNKLILIFLSFLILTTYFTNNFASKIRNKRLLGKYYITISEYRLYSPHNFYFWNKKFKSKNKKNPINRNKDFLQITFLISSAFILVYKKKVLDSHGTAKWADLEEITKRELYSKENGVVLGRDEKGNLLTHNGPEHLIMMAPTRMGKGVNTVLTTLYTWKNSIIVNDIKGECWDLTAGYRKRVLGQKVLMFAPLDDTGITCMYNPLDYILLKTSKELSEVREICTTLLDTTGKGEDDHWTSSAINLLIGVVLHVKYAKEGANMTDVVKFMTDPNKPFFDSACEVLGIFTNDDGEQFEGEKYDHAQETPDLFKKIYLDSSHTTQHPEVGSIFSTFITTPDKERGSILSSCLAKLQIFKDPIISKNSARSSFKIEDLMNEKISLYLVSPPSSIPQTRPLLRLIFTQVMARLSKESMRSGNKTLEIWQIKLQKIITPVIKLFYKAPPKKEKNKILFLIDEFPSLGKLEIFEQAMAYCAGYGLKCLLITQSDNQLKKIYGKENSVLDNCHVQIYLTPNDVQTPDMISKMLGQKTIEQKSVSRKNGLFSEKTVSTSFTGRALMTPGEVRVLPYEKLIIFVAGMSPIYGNKIFYFKEKEFMYKPYFAVPTVSDEIHTGITEEQPTEEISKKEINTKRNEIKEIMKDINFYFDDGSNQIVEEEIITELQVTKLSNNFTIKELKIYFENNSIKKPLNEEEFFELKRKITDYFKGKNEEISSNQIVEEEIEEEETFVIPKVEETLVDPKEDDDGFSLEEIEKLISEEIKKE
jgi:type IV secretion system protein VirD4